MGRALAVLIWLLTLGSVVLFFSGWWFPASISEYGPAIDRQFVITIVVVGIAFVAAQVGLGWMVWRYGQNREDREERALYTHGNNRLEIIWTVVTAIVFIALAVMGQVVWAKFHFQGAPPGAYQVRVIAQQFQWNFHYSGRDGKFGRTDPALVVDADQNYIGLDPRDPSAKDDASVATLAIPVNRPVELILRAKDVTHSFWVPQLRFKQDLVPGMENSVHFTANKIGKYELACAELCGQFHFRMKSYVLVLPEAEHAELAALDVNDFRTRIAELLLKYDPVVSD